MLLRSVQEFAVHIESFRNIDVWYQGAYLLVLQIYAQGPKPTERIFAHPFAFTEHYHQGDPEAMLYDSQVIKGASIHHPSSSFLSKAFLLRYYEEEVQLNDICHFRIETDISEKEQEFVLEVSLLFFEQQVKKIDPEAIALERGKKVKSQRYAIGRAREGVHCYLQAVFDGQYHSLANITLHSACLDYRLRMSALQLSDFSQLSQQERKQLLEKNRKAQSKQEPLWQAVARQLGSSDEQDVIRRVELLVVRGMKEYYHLLLKEYSKIFGKTILEEHRKQFGHLLVHPSHLALFDQEGQGRGWKEQGGPKTRRGSSDETLQKMINESNLISAEMIKLWHHFIDLLKVSPRFVTAYYQTITLAQMEQFWANYCKKEHYSTKDICLCSQDNHKVTEQLSLEMLKGREKVELNWAVIGEEWLGRAAFPVIVEDFYSSSLKKGSQLRDPLPPIDDSSLHLVVLVHGFQGNSLDMKMIKNTISVLYPETSFLCATSNEQLTDTDILEMGNRLAAEVKNHILEFFPPGTLQRISFIGHSLGGVIIRAALPRLLDYKDKFHTLLTFSSPHLGYKVNGSSVIGAGIWVLQKFKGSNCLKQLTMGDSADPRETVLFRISKLEGVRFFKNIFLFSSKQDSYAPFESARIEIHPDFMNAKDPLKEVHCEMVRSILEGVDPASLHRVRVSFTIEGTSIDTIIGRTAHILFLQNCELLQLFLHTHPHLFS